MPVTGGNSSWGTTGRDGKGNISRKSPGPIVGGFRKENEEDLRRDDRGDSEACSSSNDTDEGTEVEGRESSGKEIKYNVSKPRNKLDGPASSIANMNLLHTCENYECVIHCPCSICTDKRNNCRFQCRAHKCKECSSQCTKHDQLFKRSFNSEADHFTMKTDKTNKYKYAVPHAGIPLDCKSCSKDILEHQIFHLVIHTRCEFCSQDWQPFEKTTILTMRDFFNADCNVHVEEDRTCSFCAVIFDERHSRQNHEDNVHIRNDKKHNCDKCDKSYNKLSDLEYHKCSIHGDGKNYTCDHCGAEFSSKSNMLQHIQNVHKESSQKVNLECEICRETFSINSNYNRHMNELHNIDIENTLIRCGTCNEPFKRRSQMIQHERNVHCTSSYTLNCGQCNEIFNRRENLKRHIETVHVENKTIMLSCKYCEKIFYRGDSLKRHVDTVHEEKEQGGRVKKYECPYCLLLLSRKDKLNRHISTKHLQ